MNSQSVHQLSAVCFQGLHADIQNCCDLFRALAFGDELENLSLAWG